MPVPLKPGARELLGDMANSNIPIALATSTTYEHALTKLNNKEKEKGHSILGWYHSHPSYSPFMSNTDYNTQVRYQKLAKAPVLQQPVALVIDPTEISKKSYGFKIFRLEKDFKTWEEPKFEVVDAPVTTIPEMIKTMLPLTTGRPVFLEYE